MEMFVSSPERKKQATLPLTLSQGDFLVSRPVLAPQSIKNARGSKARIAGSGLRCSESCKCCSHDWSSLRTQLGLDNGLQRSRRVWRMLATTFPKSPFACRLGMLVRLIYAGDCSGLPTIVKRDHRSPGKADHPRLSASRGEPLPETIGLRLSPEFAEWMAGLPIGWTQGMTRKERIEACGDIVVPQVAEWIGRRIIEASGNFK